MTEQVGSDYRPPVIDWPNIVTGDDRYRINRLVQQGRSLPAAVAQTILEETRWIVNNESKSSEERCIEFIKQSILVGNTPDSIAGSMLAGADDIELVRTFSGAYTFGSVCFLEAERVIAGGPPLLPEIVREVLPYGARLSWWRQQQFAAVLGKKGAMSLVDFAVDIRIAELNEEPFSQATEGTLRALEAGRQRFHQLYREFPPAA